MPFQKGVVHKHKAGRPKGFKGVAKMIMRETRDGRELVEFALKVFRNEEGEYSHQQQQDALDWLSDRGLGRPMQMIDLAAALEVDVADRPRVIDALGTLTGEQRAKFREALLIASGDPRSSVERMLDERRPVIDVGCGGDDQ